MEYELGGFKAVYSQTTRGKDQLIFCNQPFIYEKCIRMPNGQMKKFWRCNQWCVFEPISMKNSLNLVNFYCVIIFLLHLLFSHTNNRWNQKCRSRVFTIGDVVTVLNKYHTHEDVIHRKKRVAKKRSDDDKDFSDIDYLLMQSDKKETSEDEDGSIFCVYETTTNN